MVNAYIARIRRGAPHDAQMNAAFQKVVHMLREPRSLFAPGIAWRVLFSARSARVAMPEMGPATSRVRG